MGVYASLPLCAYAWVCVRICVFLYASVYLRGCVRVGVWCERDIPMASTMYTQCAHWGCQWMHRGLPLNTTYDPLHSHSHRIKDSPRTIASVLALSRAHRWFIRDLPMIDKMDTRTVILEKYLVSYFVLVPVIEVVCRYTDGRAGVCVWMCVNVGVCVWMGDVCEWVN